MFSALRTRVLDFISPNSKRDSKRSRSRSRLQSPLGRVQDGRISKRDSKWNTTTTLSSALEGAILPSSSTSKQNNSMRIPNVMGGTVDGLAMSGALDDHIVDDIVSVSADPGDEDQSGYASSGDDASSLPPKRSSSSSSNRQSGRKISSSELVFPSPPNSITPSWTAKQPKWKKQKSPSKPEPTGHPGRNVTPDELSSPDSPTDNFKNNRRAPKLNKTEEAEHFLNLDVESSSVRDSLALENHPLWTKAEIDLFNKLNMRGFEPLMPRTWALDFPTIPTDLFTEDAQQAFLKAVNGTDFRAIHALSNLLGLGARVRDYVTMNKAPEKLITRYIQQYIKWSHEDGGLLKKEPISALKVIAAHGDEPVEDIVDRASRQLHDLGKEYREQWRVSKPPKALRSLKKATDGSGSIVDKGEEENEEEEDESDEFDPPLPTVYGIVIAYSTVSIVTYDSNQPNREMKALALFDFQLEDQDVWNAFAIAIVVVWVRDYLVDLGWDEVPQTAAPDPDL